MKRLFMQEWMDEFHGRVTGGRYDGNLLRAGVSNGPYVDMLMPGGGWNRIDSIYMSGRTNDFQLSELPALKEKIDEWLKL